jgi:coproporphyrinogen III oxidase
LQNGKIFEKVGVNFSKVYGKFPKQFQKNIPGAEKNPKFWASGISVVMHMRNPLIPAMHFNTRYICTTQEWFGGGMDVTPSKIDKNEKKEFHKILRNMCNRHNKSYYKKYKKWCDEYFYLPHRKEQRGIGGIFFDYKKNNFDKDFKFVRDVGVTFQLIFNKIINNKINKKWTTKDKEFQYFKRGRYVEFNLLYDRGTKFGLQTHGNVEGILMSLPPIAKWK